MHTFFINTSQKSLHGYDVLFDIHVENKAFISMECAMSDWYDKDKGYQACVKQMSDMIDGYVELNNAFNLIIYIDLPEYKAYSSIPKDAFGDKDREACCRAMHILFTHVVSESIVEQLVNSGRRPQSVLIMFGEEKKFADFHVAISDPRRPAIQEHLFKLIGLPNATVVENIAKTVEAGADQAAVFGEKVLKACTEELVPGIRQQYRTDLQLWYDEVMNSANVPAANEALFDRIHDINRVELDRIGVESVSCPYDCYACSVNKCSLALSKLNIALYLLKCVRTNSIYEKGLDDDTRQLMAFRSYTVDEVAPLFLSKEAQYAEKVREIESLTKSYAELNLAPELRSFDHAKFGLDVYGDKAADMVVGDAMPAEEAEAESENEDDTDPDVISIEGKNKEVTVVGKSGRTLFLRDELPPFDYNYDYNGHEMVKKYTTPEQYIEQAKKVRKHHLDYLKKLKVHASKLLSNYAGKSKENKPALLKVGGYRYANSGKEENVLESIESIADKAYTTMLDQYMEFCAGRSVAITDIEEQCNWFVSRVHQIKESLQKIKLVAAGLLAAIILLYIPFVVIQFEAIVKNVLTMAVALGSVAIPVVLLYLIFAGVALAQRKKYIQVWKEFKEKSDQALADNAMAARKYHELLAKVIPGLRWVYEYKLDVDYCVECCDVADAKLEHHRHKLRNRISMIRNILSDLERSALTEREPREQPEHAGDNIDYNASFCSGEKNCAFYSVIDNSLFQPENH